MYNCILSTIKLFTIAYTNVKSTQVKPQLTMDI